MRMGRMELRENKKKQEEYRTRAEALTGQMTLEEKISQMLHRAPEIKRLNIPAYCWWNEGLHGVARAGIATVFPQAIGLAATFDEDFIEKVADAISTEARAKYNMQQEFGDRDIYKGLTFWAPNVNIFRDPRWGRGHETYGEDPYLTSRMGVRFVQGLQGHDENYLKTAACAKHFAVHSGPEDIRHSFDAQVTEQDLYETYLPAFEALVKEAGVEAVMGAYNRVNGEPCCGSEMLLKKILRGNWKFEGHVTSDCWAVKDFHMGHHVTENAVQSVALAVNQGCDLNCGNLFLYLEQAVAEGLVEEETITEAVNRLFTTRMKLGMFEEEQPYQDISYETVNSLPMRELAREAARKSMVLLKNEGNLLPLDKTKIRKIGVIGPNANNRRALVGNYEGTAARYVTVAEGLQDYLGDEVRVFVADGCHLYKDKVENLAAQNDRIAEVKAVCRECDVVIACLGLDASVEGEEGDTDNAYGGADKPDLRLPGNQEEVLRVMKESGKPVVLVLLSGSALAIEYAEKEIPAIIQGWYPGEQGGMALAELLFGEYSPEGKLPVTFYRTSEELPEFTDYSMTGRTYRYMTQEAWYPFGYGLSYTEFAITDVQADTQVIGEEGITISCEAANRGARSGVVTIQVYIKAEWENTPNAQLKKIWKQNLESGERKQVSFHLPLSAFALCDTDGVRKVKKGRYSVYVGESQPDRRSRSLMGKEPIVIAAEAECEITL